MSESPNTGEVPGIRPGEPHDERLLERVRPPGWENPRPADRYDLLVVGGGTAGLVSAAIGAALGARVALVEARLLGGDCLNWGCVPSKALLAVARVAATARGAQRLEVSTGEVAVDFAEAMRRMRRLRAEISVHDSADRFREMGVDVFLGRGQFVGREQLEVDGVPLAFRRAVIATGARPAEPPIEGLAEAGYRTSETVFELASLPTRLAVVGGGPIGCELAQAFARFGAEVVLLEAADRILTSDDPDAAEVVADALRADGVDLRTDWPAERIESTGEGPKRLVGGSGDPRETLEVDEILVAVGRTPNVDGLGLDAAGVAFDAASGVRVDDRLRTTNRRIYAAGDVVPGPRFTHLSDAQARIAVRNALFPWRQKADSIAVPWCTYTDPELAHVGHTPASAAEAGVEIDTFTRPSMEVDRAILEGETGGFARIHVKRGSDEIVGGTIVGPHAGETISEVTLAIERGIGLGGLSEVIHPYPTRAEALRAVADRYRRTRLTPFAKRVIGWWLKLAR